MVPHLNAVLIAPIAKNNLAVLKRQLLQHSPEITIKGTANSIEKGRKLIDVYQPNLVFVEVSKPFCEGFEMMKQLQPIDFEIIFINNCPECPFHHTPYVKGSYLKDSSNAAELKASIAASQSNILHKMQEHPHYPTETTVPKPAEKWLRVAIKGAHQKIAFEEILYLSAHGNYTHIHLRNNTFHVECKILKLMEDLLPKDIFFRTDRSNIVNKQYIKFFTSSSIKSYVTLTNDDILFISKRRKAAFVAFYEA